MKQRLRFLLLSALTLLPGTTLATPSKQFGVMASWTSPGIDLPVIDKLYFVWDLQTGANAFGATGGGLAVYFTPAIALLTGPVFFFEKELQPGGSPILWSMQLDIDIDFKSDAP